MPRLVVTLAVCGSCPAAQCLALSLLGAMACATLTLSTSACAVELKSDLYQQSVSASSPCQKPFSSKKSKFLSANNLAVVV